MKKYSQGFMELGAMGTFIFYVVMSSVVLGILWTLFSGSKLTEMEQGLTTMTYNIQGLYSAQGSYAGLNNNVVITSKGAPEKLLRGNNLQTPWGGNITVSPGAGTDTFQIRLDDIGQDDCIKLANYQSNNWVNVAVNGAVFSADTGVSQAVTSCTDSNSITYTSR